MRLKQVKYTEHENNLQHWMIEGLCLGDSNLLVGKNASGKSRTLNIISGLSSYLTGFVKPRISGDYDVEFIRDKEVINYQLKFTNEAVVREKLIIAGNTYLDRGDGGKGTIWAEGLKKDIDFQTPTSELAAVNRRDEIQHPFFEPLFSWGSELRHFHFGTPLGKEHMAVIVEKGNQVVDDKDEKQVVPLYRHAEKKFGDQFRQAVIDDMQKIDYNVQKVGVKAPVSIRVTGLPGELMGLFVEEADLPGITDQHSMSQGMFRTLSLLIQVNYLQLAGTSTCILIDDIGEGLDFDRSCRLIDLLRDKAKKYNFQLIMSTNDRFVMNRVPLQEWSVLKRQRNHVDVLNYGNSKNLFEEFEFTGLSNFSFLEMDFASGHPAEEAETNE